MGSVALALPLAALAGGWSEAVHTVGIVGFAGVGVALALGALLRGLPGPRPALRAAHALIGLCFGVAAMSHGTAFFVRQLLQREWSAIWAPGSWLCTSVFFLVASGLVGLLSERWRRPAIAVHRIALAILVIAAALHVTPKL